MRDDDRQDGGTNEKIELTRGVSLQIFLQLNSYCSSRLGDREQQGGRDPTQPGAYGVPTAGDRGVVQVFH